MDGNTAHAIERTKHKGLTAWLLVSLPDGKLVQWSYDFREINEAYARLAS